MTDKNKPQTKTSFSFDWLISGVLTKLGDTFDRITGRGWNPSSSLATSKLTEKLKFLLDSEARDLGKKGKFVPHNINLKIQWDKFSTDAEDDLDKLRYELHAAAIDHINDKRYHTYAPLKIEILTDYFTDGVKLLSSFGKFSDKQDDEASINVTIPKMRVDDLIPDNTIQVNLTDEEEEIADDCFVVRLTANNKPFEIELNFTEHKRISVGRGTENELSINDQSVSKIHAALVLNDEKELMVADTGSTNGTFVNDQRITYGKAIMFEDDAKVKFGTIEVTFERQNIYVEEELVDEMFDSIVETPVEQELLPTQADVNLRDSEVVQQLQPTEANIGTGDLEIPQPDLTQNFESEVIKPIEPNPEKPSEKTENSDIDFRSEEFTSQPDDQDSNESEEIDIDKTQDWEI